MSTDRRPTLRRSLRSVDDVSMSRRMLLLLCVVLVVTMTTPSTGHATIVREAGLPSEGWSWPVWPAAIERPFAQPAHRYGPGHRGVDLRPLDPGIAVRSPADGTIAFAGTVADRPLVTIDHGGGLVTTLEPVVSELAPGTSVSRGEPLAEVAVGGHAEPGTVHFGVRLDGEYINPLVLLGGVPRAVLLPCCD